MRVFFTYFFFLISFNIFAQTPQQNVRGITRDYETLEPLAGVTLFLLGKENKEVASTQSDENGSFLFKGINVGRYSMRIQYLGYTALRVSEIIVKGGKETILNINLEANVSYDLSEITVKAPKQKQLSPVSVRTLTIEEVLRFPATYYDPARMAVTLPGVVNTNDQSNSLSVRGNSPNALTWRLEGAEIVNPNHTPNAGTTSDRVTLAGGGVNMLSAQMLGTTHFLTGAFPAEFGNTLGAIMDMSLKEGNRKNHEFTAQIGLIGIDLAAEGPFGKNEKSGFLANYRYSTVGLLSDLGVDLGDEEISFEDLAVKADFLNKKGGKLSIFGVGGKSKNIFAAQRDTALWEFQKDRFDIDFSSKTGIGGMSYEQNVGAKSRWKTTLVHSVTENTRTGERLSDDFVKDLVENDKITYQKTALHSIFSHRLSTRSRLKFGLDATLHQFDVLAEDFQTRQFSRGKGEGILWQPYVHLNRKISTKVSLDVGLHYTHFGFNNTNSIEPRASVTYQVKEKTRWSFAYGLHSQIQLPQLYLARTVTDGSNRDLALTKAHHLVLSYNFQTEKGDDFTMETYYQSFFDVPASFSGGTSFSALNLLEGFTSEPLESTGTGRNIGLEISWQKYFTDDFYYLFNASFYDAKYRDAKGKSFNTRYNGNYIFNATGGKEWSKTKKNKLKTFGLNMRMGYAGGFRYTPIDAVASREAGVTVFGNNTPFSEQFPAYFKTDVRLYWKKSKEGRNTIWALDIQNLTNQKNAAFRYFDTEKGEIVTKNQLGLLPILSWKVEF